MSSNELNADLTALQSDYQILTELRCSASSRTYLARHLELNRDVTITVIRAPGDGGNNTLTHFASDARTLAGIRHANVVPVIEGRWLADDVFAIVRARVRGSTLAQVVKVDAHMPLQDVATTLEQVNAAIEWARTNGIVHRHVSPDSIALQQGSGRVLLELDPEVLGPNGVPDACDDARTIGRLAWQMLSGGGDHAGDASAKSLAAARPELPASLVRETEALMNCDRSGSGRDAAALIAAIRREAKPLAGVPLNARDAGAAVDVRPVPSDVAVVIVKRPFGFNARFATAVAVAGMLAVLGALLLHRRGPSVPPSNASSAPFTDEQAAGEVALPASRRDTFAAATPTFVPSTPSIAPMITPPITRRHEPLRDSMLQTLPYPIATPADSLAQAQRKPTSDTGAGISGRAAAVCSSPDPDDQHACLLDEIDRNDGTLKAVYQRLVAALRRQANVQASDPDPDTVDELRSAEHKWLAVRDAACRGVGDGPLYARVRAQCFAEQSAARTRELQDMLNAIP